MQLTRHGYWIAEAGMPEAKPPLRGEQAVDVAIIGGGYTGMWTAWHLTRLEPGARVAILESEVCGTGPSGRNGGFVNAMWFSLPRLVAAHGDEQALRIADAADESVRRIGAFCQDQRIDAWFHNGGYVHVSAAEAQDGAWAESVRECARLGRAGAVAELGRDQVQIRCASPVFRTGVVYETGATIQPARLAFGLRERLINRGVRVYEQTRARRLRPRPGGEIEIETDGGRITAGKAILAAGSANSGWPGLRRRLTIVSSHIVATEPVPDLVEEIGWSGGESITDSRALLHYFRTTPDGRIVFGWGGGKTAFGSRTTGRTELDPALIDAVRKHLTRVFPKLGERRIDYAWGGPIDASPAHLPMVVSLRGGSAYAAFGYTGNGVGPSQLLGRSLASLALERDDWAASLAFIDPPPRKVPPEPLRFIGGAAIRAALVRKESLEERGERAGPLTRLIARVPELIGFHIGR